MWSLCKSKLILILEIIYFDNEFLLMKFLLMKVYPGNCMTL